MVTAAGTRCWKRSRKQLPLCDRLDVDLLVEGLDRCSVDVRGQIREALFEVFVPLIEEILLGSTLPIVTRRDKKGKVVFNVAQSVENFDEFLHADFFLLLLPRLCKVPFAVAHFRSSGASREVSVDADPRCFVLLLNEFESVKWTHIARALLRNGLLGCCFGCLASRRRSLSVSLAATLH